MMICLGYTSNDQENKRKRGLDHKEKKKRENDSSQKLLQYGFPDECIRCYDRFPASLRFPCGHELCASCVDKVIKVCEDNNCPECQMSLPKLLQEYKPMIYPSQLTFDIPLEKLQHAFPLICSAANVTTVAKCILIGVDADTEGLFGIFPLHLVSQKPVVKYLIKNGANVNKKNGDGATPLFVSSEYGHLPVVEHLVRNGAKVNHVDNNGVTPLFFSCQNGHLLVVEYLIKHGANVNQVNNHGVTPLVVSSQNGRLAIVKYLIKHEADVNKQALNGATSLFMSSQNGHLSVVRYLINNGANVNQATNDGVTPLLVSSQNGHLLIVKGLIKNGADVNHLTKSGETPLTKALYENHTEVAKFLLKKGANVEMTKSILEKDGHSKLLVILYKICNEMKE